MRIVSMLGSATEIVFELGLADQLVGVSHECDYPPEAARLPSVSRPRFDPAGMASAEVDAAVRAAMAEAGSVYELDTALLEELRPDLVLAQAVCEACAVPTASAEDAVRQLSSQARVLSVDAHDIQGILDSIVQVANAAGVGPRGLALRNRLQDRLDAVAETVHRRPRPRVLLLEWLDPPFAPGHWVPEMVQMAGGENLIGHAGLRSRQIEWSEIEGLDPDVLLIEPCGYDLAEAVEDANRRRRRLESVAGRAVVSGRAWVLHSSWFSRSGPRVVEGVEVLQRIFHPDALPPDAQCAIPWH